MYADLLIIDGSDIPFDFRVIKRFIDTHRNVFALKYSDAEKKECDYCIAKIKRKSILKLSYFLKGRDPEIETDPLIDLFNSQDGTEMGFVNWNFLLSKTEENPEIKAVENV
jgi:hypothetical protein